MFAISDVITLIVLGVSEDHQDALGGKVVQFAPEAWPNEQSLGGRAEHDAFFAGSVEQAHPHAASDADAELAKFLVGVEAAADAGSRAVDPVDPPYDERQRTSDLDDSKLSARISFLRDWHQLDERRGHQRGEPTRA